MNKGFIPHSGWMQSPEPPPIRLHVLPVDDTRPHVESGIECPCAPSVSSDGRVVVHNAWDGREFAEEGWGTEYVRK